MLGFRRGGLVTAEQQREMFKDSVAVVIPFPQRERQRRADVFPPILAQADIDAAVLREQRERRATKLKWAVFYAVCALIGFNI